MTTNNEKCSFDGDAIGPLIALWKNLLILLRTITWCAMWPHLRVGREAPVVGTPPLPPAGLWRRPRSPVCTSGGWREHILPACEQWEDSMLWQPRLRSQTYTRCNCFEIWMSVSIFNEVEGSTTRDALASDRLEFSPRRIQREKNRRWQF